MTEKNYEDMTQEEREQYWKKWSDEIEKNKCPNCGSLIGLMEVTCYGLCGPAKVCRTCGFATRDGEVINPGLFKHHGSCW